jgi:hypothetical protein
MEVASERYWAPHLLVSGVRDSETIQILLRKLGSVSGTLALEEHGGTLPEEVQLRFEPNPAPACARCKAPSAVRGEVRCPVEAAAWRCVLPEGALDLRLEAPGFIPYYRFDSLIVAGEDLPFGPIPLAVGASAIGRVERQDGAPAALAQVTLSPDLGDLPPTPGSRVSMARHTVTTDERGFFQAQGLPPGSYLIHAEREAVRSQILRGDLRARQEFELPQPLVLSPPLHIEFHLTPPVDPEGKPWSVRLLSRQPPVNRSGQVDTEGRWMARPLEPAEYVLMVLDHRGARFHFDQIRVEPGTGSHEIDIPLVEIEGKVVLGDEPLRAKLYFGGRSGRTSIVLESDEEGHFAGVLPRGGEWPLDIAAENPALLRRLAAVVVEPAEGSSKARLTLSLPDTRLAGEVVDAAGQGVEGASVLIAPVDQQEKLSPVRTHADGRFEARGFAPGRFRLEAHATSGEIRRSSPPVELEIQETLDPNPVRLVLEEQYQLRGRIVAPTGTGIPGASLIAVPSQGSGPGVTLLPQAQSGPDGHFTMSVPRGTTTVDLTILAPGFLFYRQTLAAPEDRSIVLSLAQQGGGDLILEGISPAEAGSAWLEHHGARWDLATLLRWARMHSETLTADGVRIPRVPSGAYRLCTPGKATCIDGWLPDLESLVLAVDSSQPDAAIGQEGS